MREPTYVDSYTGPRIETTAARGGLLGKVFGLLAFSMVFTAIGAFVSVYMGLGQAMALPALIGMLILSFVLGAVRNVSGVNLIAMYALTLLAGIALGGIAMAYVAAGAGAIVLQAAAMTGVITFGMAAYGLTTGRDLSGLGSKLFFAILALVAVSIIGIFIGGSLLQLLIGLAGAVIFSLYIAVQVQQIHHAEDTLGNAIMIAIGLYLSIFNLFLSLLRILGFLGGSDE